MNGMSSRDGNVPASVYSRPFVENQMIGPVDLPSVALTPRDHGARLQAVPTRVVLGQERTIEALGGEFDEYTFARIRRAVC